MDLQNLIGDAISWVNYTPTAYPAEAARVSELVPDPARAADLLGFGFRPMTCVDLNPYYPNDYDKPWEPQKDDLIDEPVMADIHTGWVFRVEEKGQKLLFDPERSQRYTESQELLFRAMHRPNHFEFKAVYIPAMEEFLDEPDTYPVVQPIEIVASNQDELNERLDQLRNLFCGHLRVRRLWLRGQRVEYPLKRDESLSAQLYGASRLPSLTPSLARYAVANPAIMNLKFVRSGPNHFWKKPFLIWIMRQNQDWFAHDDRFMPFLTEVLSDSNDMRFAEVLAHIRKSPLENRHHLEWPVEANFLRKDFFALMKRYGVAVTMQQYGYYTSLLDLTKNADVALYFTQSRMVDNQMRKLPPAPGRVIHVFAESSGDSYRNGAELFWGDDDWVREQPPRLSRQKAGFIMGSSHRAQNFYGMMVIARIRLIDDGLQTTLSDSDLFPDENDDLLLSTLRASRPPLEGLY